MKAFLEVLLILAEAVVFIGPIALVVYYLRAKLGMEGRENAFGAPPRPGSSWVSPKLIVSAWVLAVGVMVVLRWNGP